MNTPVKFELAKLLKEKGFDKRTSCYYKKDMSFSSQEGYLNGREFNAPTIIEIVMWLFEKHGVWIYVKQGYKWEWFIETVSNHPKLKYNDGLEDSPTLAYEAAIEYTLKNLLKSI